MTNKTLFWSFYCLPREIVKRYLTGVNFCTFCASLRPKRTVFTRPKTSMISVYPVIMSNFSPCLRVLRDEKIREISVNPWLINDLRSTKDYVRKNNLFMQNKANFQKVKFNVNQVLTTDYVQMDTWSSGKNKPNSKPIQTQFKPNQSQFLYHCLSLLLTIASNFCEFDKEFPV
jgi:hypothetical protein